MNRGSVLSGNGRRCFAVVLSLAVVSLSLLAEVAMAAGLDATPVANTGSSPEILQRGIASYYADRHHGELTANGEKFDMNGLTAAHKTLPFGTKLRVTSLANHRSVLVRVNDRGPFVKGRIIDLSLGAAKELQMIRSGVAEVTITVVR